MMRLFAFLLGWVWLAGAAQEGTVLEPLTSLNTPNDEVILGWDGHSLFYRSIPRASDTAKSGLWFLTPGQEYAAELQKGWTGFAPADPMNLRAWSAADWPGIGPIQHVAIDAERGVLVLSAQQPSGDFDLFMAQRDGDSWTVPVALTGLNTRKDEVFPNFEQGALLFASNGHDGPGGFDVFQSARSTHYQSCLPLPIGVNTSGDELAAVPVSKSAGGGYYVSAVRMNGSGVDLWWTSLQRPDTPASSKALAAELVHRREPVQGAQMEVKRRSGEVLVQKTTDVQGRMELGAVALDAALEVTVSMADGRSELADGTICHIYERCSSPNCGEGHWPGWKRVRSYRIEGGKAFVFDLLPLDALARWPRPSSLDGAIWQSNAPAWVAYFPSSESALDATSEDALRQWLRTHEWEQLPGYFEAIGYTDARGEVVRNQLLSEQRAASTAAALERAGVPAHRVKWSGHGVAPAVGKEMEQRRVEVRWVATGR